MPKKLISPGEKLNQVHPFRRAYHQIVRNPENVRQQIMDRLGWSQATFYRKLYNDKNLTQVEAEEVAKVLGILSDDIIQFQSIPHKSR